MRSCRCGTLLTLAMPCHDDGTQVAAELDVDDYDTEAGKQLQSQLGAACAAGERCGRAMCLLCVLLPPSSRVAPAGCGI